MQENDAKYQIDLLTAMNEKLMDSEKVYRLVSEFTGLCFIYVDFRDPSNPHLIGDWAGITGLNVNSRNFDKNIMLSLMDEKDQKEFDDRIISIEKHGRDHDSMVFRSADKKEWIEAVVKVCYDKKGEPENKIYSFKNVTKDVRDDEELKYLAYYDSLTGLYNRNYFVKKLRDLCGRADEEKTCIELLFIDIDDFKKINDSLGLIYGDELVQDFSAFIKDMQDDNIFAGRFGSDVFSIAIYNPCGNRSAEAIYKEIRERLRKPYVLTNKTEVTFTVSAGVSEYPGSGSSALELIKNAEIVLYKAKENGKNNIRYFENNILKEFIESVSMENAIRSALEERKFVMFFQPLYSAGDKKLRGAEALIRWPDENGGFLSSPSEFIPIAEKNGDIIQLGDFVLNETLKMVGEWKNKYHYPLIVSVNISSIQLSKDDFVDNIEKLIDQYDVDPENLELELTESVFIEDFDDIIDKISTLRRMGVRISLDDFGTGFSSLSYLRNLPINTLKIDKSFVDSVIEDRSTGIITESVIAMVKKLGFETVAEGVECKEQFDYLRESGCDIIQGFLLGRPMSGKDFEKLIVRQLP